MEITSVVTEVFMMQVSQIMMTGRECFKWDLSGMPSDPWELVFFMCFMRSVIVSKVVGCYELLTLRNIVLILLCRNVRISRVRLSPVRYE